MQVVLIILSLGLLGVIIFFAVSPKSSRLLKLVSLIALGLIVLSICVSGFFIIKGPDEAPQAIPLPALEAAPVPAKSGNVTAMLLFLAVLLFVLGVIIVIAIRGPRKKGGPRKETETEKFPVLPNEPEFLNRKKDEEDSFDIDVE